VKVPVGLIKVETAVTTTAPVSVFVVAVVVILEKVVVVTAVTIQRDTLFKVSGRQADEIDRLLEA
jgi:hypothetical protein